MEKSIEYNYAVKKNAFPKGILYVFLSPESSCWVNPCKLKLIESGFSFSPSLDHRLFQSFLAVKIIAILPP